MSLRSGILLFNSRGTCARCLGSRHHINTITAPYIVIFLLCIFCY